jgi:hypothetical protein
VLKFFTYKCDDDIKQKLCDYLESRWLVQNGKQGLRCLVSEQSSGTISMELRAIPLQVKDMLVSE